MSKTPSNDSFDYRVAHHCQYPIPGEHFEYDCEEPAAYYGWWDNENDGWWICKEHLDCILAMEI